jgi:hypothetical protein
MNTIRIVECNDNCSYLEGRLAKLNGWCGGVVIEEGLVDQLHLLTRDSVLQALDQSFLLHTLLLDADHICKQLLQYTKHH